MSFTVFPFTLKVTFPPVMLFPVWSVTVAVSVTVSPAANSTSSMFSCVCGSWMLVVASSLLVVSPLLSGV